MILELTNEVKHMVVVKITLFMRSTSREIVSVGSSPTPNPSFFFFFSSSSFVKPMNVPVELDHA